MRIVVLSGKGGTGKTTVTSSLALALSRKRKLVLVDADADCPNQHMLFKGDPFTETPLRLTKTAVVDTSIEVDKGIESVCRFAAISVQGKTAHVDPHRCEGCGACAIVSKAFSLKPKLTGRLVMRMTEAFPLVYGQLEPGESGSGKVVFEARKAAEGLGRPLMVIDAPAGIGCPLIAAVTGTEHAIGVVEPTPASMANLERALDVVRHFKVPYSVVLNKEGLSKEHEDAIRMRYGDRLIASIPYDEEVPRLLAKGIPPIEGTGDASKALRQMAVCIEGSILDRGSGQY